MYTAKLIKGFTTASAALALSLSLSSQASAVPVFQVTPSVLGGPAAPFMADQINGIMSSLVTYDAVTNTTSGSGYIAFNGFGLGNVPVGAGTSGLTVTYDLFVRYTFSSQVNGVFGTPNQEDTLTSLNYTLWGAAYGTTVFTIANASTNTAATAVNAGASQIGSGSLQVGITGFDSQGGAFVNSTTNYANTAFGSTFFTQPFPFYDVAFNSFNNTRQGVSRVGNVVSVNQAIGNIDFAQAVPEPVSLALFGLGLVAAFCATRRRKI